MLMRIALVVGLLCSSLAVGADVYRWVDQQGRVHYSDKPDANNAEHMNVASRPSNQAAISQRNQSDAQNRSQADAQAQQQKQDQASADAVKHDVDKTRAQQCDEAKERYRVAIESQKLYRIGKDGEREYLTSAEIDEARLNSRKEMDQLCASGS